MPSRSASLKFKWKKKKKEESTTPPPRPSPVPNETAAGSSQSFIESRNLVISDGHFNHIHGHHSSIVINFNQNIHPGLGSVSSLNSQYPHVKDNSDSNHLRPSKPETGSSSGSLPSQGAQSGTQRTVGSVYGLQDVGVASGDNPSICISSLLHNLTIHPSKYSNDMLLSKVHTHDDDWSSFVSQTSRENGSAFSQPKEMMSESCVSVNHLQVSEVMTTEVMERRREVSSGNSDKNSKGKGRQNDDYSELIDSAIAISDIDYGPVSCDEVAWDKSKVDLPAKSDIIIAVMGPTGAGKSTFINKAARTEGAKAGHGLESCTQSVQTVRCFDEQRDRWVVFVDTPGFNDTNTSDLDILQLIANWLKLTYEKDIRLSGLFFFHRISDNRMGGSPLRYLKMFQNLCGKDALKNVVLVTTMWDEVTEEEGRNREKELSEHYWKSMLEMGSHASRFYNTTESAWGIISQLQTTRRTLLLQTELVDQGLELAETSAGRTLFNWLIEFIKMIKEILTQIEAKLKQNQFPGNRGVVEQERTVMETTLREANARRKRYSSRILGRFRMPRPSSTTSTTPLFSTPRTNASASLVSSPASEYFLLPLSPAVGISEAYGGTAVLQRTITALKLVDQLVGLSSLPDLQSLVGLVLSISEIVNNMYIAEEALVGLANKAGSFLVTLVERGSISSLSDSDTVKLVIERLTKEMNLVFKVIKENFSQRTAKPLFLSASDKAVVDECNKQIELACEISGIQIVFISQLDITRIEAKLNKMCGPIPPQSNQQATTAARYCTHCTNQEPGG